MNILYDIKNALHAALNPPAVKSARLGEIDSEVISEYSNGNIFLQFGRFSTREDIDKEIEEVVNYKFS